jgi:hypothetical protein
MRQIFIGLFLMALLFTTSSYASGVEIPLNVERNFHYLFGTSTQVKWTNLKGIYKAEFTIGKEKVSEFFNEEGEVIALARYMKVSDLPEKLEANLYAMSMNQKIKEIFEVSDSEHSTYYVTLSDGTSEKVLYSSDSKWKLFIKPGKK